MSGKREYNHETFPVGTRVIVHAATPMEGSDYDWHGYTGTLLANGPWTLVQMDSKPRAWPSKEVYLCNHNLRRAPSFPPQERADG